MVRFIGSDLAPNFHNLMQEDTKRVRVSINFGESGTVYGCGHSLDTLFYAFKLYTEEDLFSNSFEWEYEVVNDVLREYDFEAYTLERLNALPTMAHESEYLHGDYLRFERPESFKEAVKEDKERIMDAVHDQIGDWSGEEIPRDLAKELTRTLTSYQEQVHHEWLHGGRSTPGALAQLAQAVFGRFSRADIDWDTKTDTVYIDAGEDEWREWLGYDLGEEEALPSADKLAERVKAFVIRKAEAIRAEKKRKAEARQGELEDRKRREAERLEREKEAARERKRQRDLAI